REVRSDFRPRPCRLGSHQHAPRRTRTAFISVPCRASRRPSDRGPFQLELALTQIGHGQNTGEDKAPPSLIDWLGGSLILPLGIAGVHDPLSSSRVPTGRRATG